MPMSSPEPPPSYPRTLNLEGMLRRSVELDLAVLDILRPESYELHEEALDTVLSFSAGELGIGHARAIRTLVAEGFDPSAASLLRLQFEALVRSIWLAWAAEEKHLLALDAEVSLDSELAAGKALPGLTSMIKALRNVGPSGCFEMLDGFRAMILPTLNSFVHSGFHPLKLRSAGYDENLMIRFLKDSNAIFTMTAMQLASLTGNPEIISPMSKIQPHFADCLPPLLTSNA